VKKASVVLSKNEVKYMFIFVKRNTVRIKLEIKTVTCRECKWGWGVRGMKLKVKLLRITLFFSPLSAGD
jgi:RNase P subunit RPR2